MSEEKVSLAETMRRRAASVRTVVETTWAGPNAIKGQAPLITMRREDALAVAGLLDAAAGELVQPEREEAVADLAAVIEQLRNERDDWRDQYKALRAAVPAVPVVSMRGVLELNELLRRASEAGYLADLDGSLSFDPNKGQAGDALLAAMRAGFEARREVITGRRATAVAAADMAALAEVLRTSGGGRTAAEIDRINERMLGTAETVVKVPIEPGSARHVIELGPVENIQVVPAVVPVGPLAGASVKTTRKRR